MRKEDCCVAVAVFAVMESDLHRNKIYNITGPELLDFGQVAEVAGQHYGQVIPMESVSDEETFPYFDAMGIPREPSEEF